MKERVEEGLLSERRKEAEAEEAGVWNNRRPSRSFERWGDPRSSKTRTQFDSGLCSQVCCTFLLFPRGGRVQSGVCLFEQNTRAQMSRGEILAVHVNNTVNNVASGNASPVGSLLEYSRHHHEGR